MKIIALIEVALALSISLTSFAQEAQISYFCSSYCGQNTAVGEHSVTWDCYSSGLSAVWEYASNNHTCVKWVPNEAPPNTVSNSWLVTSQNKDLGEAFKALHDQCDGDGRFLFKVLDGSGKVIPWENEVSACCTLVNGVATCPR